MILGDEKIFNSYLLHGCVINISCGALMRMGEDTQLKNGSKV